MKLVDINKGEATVAKVTYKQVILDHLEKTPKEYLDAEVDMLMLVGVTEHRSVYSIVHGDDRLRLIGMLDMIKHYLVIATVNGDDYE